MGEFDHVNTGGNNGGEFGQLELAIAPETSPSLLSALLCLGLAIFAHGNGYSDAGQRSFRPA
jgi:hypothetical protein